MVLQQRTASQHGILVAGLAALLRLALRHGRQRGAAAHRRRLRSGQQSDLETHIEGQRMARLGRVGQSFAGRVVEEPPPGPTGHRSGHGRLPEIRSGRHVARGAGRGRFAQRETGRRHRLSGPGRAHRLAQGHRRSHMER